MPVILRETLLCWKGWQFTLRHGLIGISKDDFGLISEHLIKTA